MDIFWFKWSMSDSKFGQKLNFLKVLLFPKFNHNSFIIDVKKKILYYIGVEY